MKPKNFPNRKQARRETAEQRAALRSLRTDAEQLRRIKGKGHTSGPEFNRLRRSR